jgi:hypothetical protein
MVQKIDIAVISQGSAGNENEKRVNQSLFREKYRKIHKNITIMMSGGNLCCFNEIFKKCTVFRFELPPTIEFFS